MYAFENVDNYGRPLTMQGIPDQNTDQSLEEGDIVILPIGINHKAANLAIL